METKLDNLTLQRIADGELLNLKAASLFAGIPYQTFRRRVYRDNIPIIERNGRLYISRFESLNPSLKVR